MRLVAWILSYNLPALTDKLFDQLSKLHDFTVEGEHLCVLDNGSKPDLISKHTTHRLEENRRLTGGWNECIRLAKEMKADHIWLLSNDIEFVTNVDPVESIFRKIGMDQKIGCVHPSLVRPITNYAYPWMIKIPDQPEKEGIENNVKMVDFIAPFFRAKALKDIGWYFDPAFKLGWGIDWETTYLLRKQGYTIGIDFDSTILHQTSVVYDGGLDLLFTNRKQYYNAAHEEMHRVMLQKYGPEWVKLFQE